MSNLSAAEQKVRKLARLPGNCICPNCGLEKPKFGFGNVCAKFLTFVCNDCKSSHQAISHRCKSLTMSSWTDQEVEQLEQHGNDVCRNTWLQHAPQPGTQGRPQPGSDISVYKRFVVDVYERRKYYGESTTTTSTSGPVPEEPPPTSPGAPPAFAKAPPVVATRVKAPKVSAPRAAQPTEAPTADLLDFFSEPPPTTTATTTTNTTTAATFTADFSNLSTPPTAATFTADFSNFSTPPTAATFTADFSNFSTPSTLAPNTTPVAATADFFGDFHPTPVAPPVSAAPSWMPPPLTSTSVAPMTTMNSQSATISSLMAPTRMMSNRSTMQYGNMNGMCSYGNMNVMLSNGMTMNGNGMMNNGMAMNGGMNYGRNDMNGMTYSSNLAMNSGVGPMNSSGMNMNGMNSHGMNNGFAVMNGGSNMNGMNGGFAVNGGSNVAGSGLATNHGMVMNPSTGNYPMAFSQSGQEPKKGDPFADLRPFQS